MQEKHRDLITPEQAGTLHGLFLERVKRTPGNIAYRYFDVHREAWLTLTWAQTFDQMTRWQLALQREGLIPGDRVALMLRNCPEWVMFEQAAMSLGLVVVPLYTVDRPDNVAYIINDAQVKVLLFETAEQWQALRTVRDQLGGIKRLVSIDKIPEDSESRLQCAQDWLPAEGRKGWERVRDRDTLATIIYTSGTTGKPKGVMLSHYNILYNAYESFMAISLSFDSSDISLSFLPLSHTFERTVGYYMPMMAGEMVAYARSIPLLAEDLLTIRPTALIAVPRIYERIYNAIHAKLEAGPPLRRKLFKLAVDVGWHRFERQQGRAGWHPKLLLWPLLKRLVADKVMDRLGGRLRISLSGGAALSPKVSRLFIAFGLPLIQGYGLTETSPVISANHIDDNYPSSVGLPLSGIEVRIGEHNALLVRGPSNMLGYLNNPAATAAMIDKDGWLNTGDTARISETGHIYITGRLKEIVVMSNGEKVPPADIEEAILRDRLFEQVMVYGEGRPKLVALAVVNPEQWQAFAQQVGVRADMPEALHDSRVEQQVLDRIAEQIREFPGYANVRRVLLLTEQWSIENGLLTPTLKLKRPQVAARYAEQIEQLYEGR
ncbi:MAG: AMP-dependent synthetase and ligase [Candidatus Gallionella acididurans]|uniref:AMP-dependent synthetase and ligase n=1 Tax=Candidatus Gallionella acididurans TaxID=1796491 RepID=A0A139BW25_9PROT|nr:MAG: AMP-dependent synthetase and ligase [Candidatus Gallionella acididurans]